IAAGYDRRYDLHDYAGVRETLLTFLSAPTPAAAVLEVGCGTGHWLREIGARWHGSRAAVIAGVEPSSQMIARARGAAPDARLVRGGAERLPLRDASFDRVYCVNA